MPLPPWGRSRWMSSPPELELHLSYGLPMSADRPCGPIVAPCKLGTLEARQDLADCPLGLLHALISTCHGSWIAQQKSLLVWQSWHAAPHHGLLGSLPGPAVHSVDGQCVSKILMPAVCALHHHLSFCLLVSSLAWDSMWSAQEQMGRIHIQTQRPAMA